LSDSATEKRSLEPAGSAEAGAHSLAEILSQAQCWESCLGELRVSQTVSEIAGRFKRDAEWLFIGCGSSYYVALAAATTMKSLTGGAARAIPASEILLYPELVFPGGPCVPVLISRSGQTSEVVQAAEIIKRNHVPSVAVTCAQSQLLEKVATITITIPADERSTVMTRSFTSMLLTLQFLAGRVAGSESYCDALAAMPQLAAEALDGVPEQIGDFVARHTFADYVCLGQGPFYGLACEYALKAMEMSVSYSQSFHSLEFRHGPKSIVSPETLVTFLLSEKGYEAECDLLEEVKSLGATTAVITPRANTRVRAAADLTVELPLTLPELARLAPSVVPGQLLGLYSGLKKGLNPDLPRFLTRAVVLGNGSKRSESVA
jgi:glutamine---fructose-6-phosphate transaminase (isomerizing)